MEIKEGAGMSYPKFIEVHRLDNGERITINIDRINYFCPSTGYKNGDYHTKVSCTEFVYSDEFYVVVKESFDDIVKLMQRI